MDEKVRRQNTNSTLIAAIAVLAGLNTIVLTSDLGNVVRYGVGIVSVIAMLACVAVLSRNMSRNSDVDSRKTTQKDVHHD